jgi:UDP:flavonoid glycosyltransferase YjiC (YdhE family)
MSRSFVIRVVYVQELQKFLDEVKGVIYFSLGSNVRSVPEEKRRVFIEAFSELPQKIL